MAFGFSFLCWQCLAQPTDPGIYATFATSLGEITCKLKYDERPRTVANFITLAEGTREWIDFSTSRIVKRPYYDHTFVHQVQKDILFEGGASDGMGFKGPGFEMTNEITPLLTHQASGLLSMRNATGGMFCITLGAAPLLDETHTIFGEVVDGMDVVQAIGNVETDTNQYPVVPIEIEKVDILRIGVAAEAFDPLATGLALPKVSGVQVQITAETNDYRIRWQGEENHRYHVARTEDLQDWTSRAEGPFQMATQAVSVDLKPSISNFVKETPHQFFQVMDAEVDPPAQTPTVLWKFKTGDAIYSPAAVKDGIVYFGSLDTRVYALDVETGRQIWIYKTGGKIYGEAALYGDYLYIISDDGKLHKLNNRTGESIWTFSYTPMTRVFDPYTAWDYRTSRPLESGGTVYFGGENFRFYAVDAQTGLEKWNFRANDRIRSSPVIANGMVLFGSYDWYLYAVNKDTGLQVWKFSTGGPINSSPAVEGNSVYIGSRSAALFSVSLTTGKQLWKLTYGNGSWVESTAVLSGGNLYIGSSDWRTALCVNPANGLIKWQRNMTRRATANPVLAEGKMYMAMTGANFDPSGTENGALACLNPATGAQIWRYEFALLPGVMFQGISGTPARAGDMLLFGVLDGNFYGIRDRVNLSPTGLDGPLQQ